MRYDIFISHASEDKAAVARPLAKALTKLGLVVWLDEFELTVGDSLRRSIDRGLMGSRYGAVVLSPHFFRKEWPQKELDGLVALEDGSGKVILPIWHQVGREEVRKYSPVLADRLASNTLFGISAVANDIWLAVERDSAKSGGENVEGTRSLQVRVGSAPNARRSSLAAAKPSLDPITGLLLMCFVLGAVAVILADAFLKPYLESLPLTALLGYTGGKLASALLQIVVATLCFAVGGAIPLLLRAIHESSVEKRRRDDA